MVVVDSSSGSTTPRPVRATWPFIVIYTIINDTDHQRKRDLRRFGGNSCLSRIIPRPISRNKAHMNIHQLNLLRVV